MRVVNRVEYDVQIACGIDWEVWGGFQDMFNPNALTAITPPFCLFDLLSLPNGHSSQKGVHSSPSGKLFCSPPLRNVQDEIPDKDTTNRKRESNEERGRAGCHFRLFTPCSNRSNSKEASPPIHPFRFSHQKLSSQK